MKAIISFCLILLIANVLSSCEKVIDIDIKGAGKEYMIEGVISDQSGDCKVLIRQTKDFDEDNNFPGVSGAVVNITDNGTGTTSVLTETSAGIYSAASLSGAPGNSYTLRVKIGDKEFTAQSTMPAKVEMDTIYVTDENMFGEVWKLSNIEFQDPEGIENSYRFIQYINGVRTKQLFIRNDDLVDGRLFSTLLYMDPDTEDDKKLESGDTVQIEMHGIDRPVYKFWFSLEQSATGESNSASPANPVTNIQGGALGYFSAYTKQSMTMIVP